MDTLESSRPRGAFIVVEGLDRAGKSTQVAELVTRWNAQPERLAEMIRFPDRTTTIGQNLNAYLTQADSGKSLPLAAAHLLFSANRWEASSALRAKLEAGTTLIVDRYSYSGAVYTAAKASLAADAASGSMTLDWSWAPEVGLPAPDLLLFLDIEEEEAARRGGFGTERYETAEMQHAVRRTFYELLDQLQTRPEAAEQVVRIDANQARDPVTEAIWAATEKVRDALHAGSLHELRQLQALPGVTALASD